MSCLLKSKYVLNLPVHGCWWELGALVQRDEALDCPNACSTIPGTKNKSFQIFWLSIIQLIRGHSNNIWHSMGEG